MLCICKPLYTWEWWKSWRLYSIQYTSQIWYVLGICTTGRSVLC